MLSTERVCEPLGTSPLVKPAAIRDKPLPHQFVIDVEPVAGPRRQPLGRRDRLENAQQRQGRPAREVIPPQAELEQRHRQRRQGRRDLLRVRRIQRVRADQRAPAPLCQPSSTTAPLTTASVISTEGTFGLIRRMPHSITSETAATARARQFVSPSEASVRISERIVSGRYSVSAAHGSGCSWACGMPRALRSWPRMIRMPAAARNPVRADCATYRTICPSFSSPPSSRISPLATPRASMMPMTTPTDAGHRGCKDGSTRRPAGRWRWSAR